MITFDYYFYFWLLLWSTSELLDRALYKLSFIYLLFIRKIYPVYLEFIQKKGWKIGLKIGFGNQGSIPLEGRILRIYPAFSRIYRENKLFLKFVTFSFFFFIFK